MEHNISMTYMAIYEYTLRNKGANRVSVGSLMVPGVVFGVLHST